jgi:hypothetical protein
MVVKVLAAVRQPVNVAQDVGEQSPGDGHIGKLATSASWPHRQAGHIGKLATSASWPHRQAGHIGKLERDVTTMANKLGADFHQLLPHRGHQLLRCFLR